jgi:hypothetical protein
MQLTKAQYEKCQKIFMDLREEALYLSHYQLAEITEINDAMLWKSFLMDNRTTDYIATEMNLIRNASINKMVSKAADSHSVGQSQLITALQKLDEKSTQKEGPVFIYSHVPLNDEQANAPNTRECNSKGVIKLKEGEFLFDA